MNRVTPACMCLSKRQLKCSVWMTAWFPHSLHPKWPFLSRWRRLLFTAFPISVCLGNPSTQICVCWCFPSQTDLLCRGVHSVFQVRGKIGLDYNFLNLLFSGVWFWSEARSEADNRVFLTLVAIVCTCFVCESLSGTPGLFWYLTIIELHQFMLWETPVKIMLGLAYLFYPAWKQLLAEDLVQVLAWYMQGPGFGPHHCITAWIQRLAWATWNLYPSSTSQKHGKFLCTIGHFWQIIVDFPPYRHLPHTLPEKSVLT